MQTPQEAKALRRSSNQAEFPQPFVTLKNVLSFHSLRGNRQGRDFILSL
jgi:hypothetical protein